MALVALEPLREMATLQNEMNRLFGTFFDTPAGGSNAPNGTAVRRWLPAMDLVETADHFVLRADLPGLDEGDVRVELEDNILTVAGERNADHEEKGEGFYRLERVSGTFSRSLTLPEGIDPEAISATFDRGVLEVRIPKPEERKPRRVAIKVGDTPAAIEGSGS
jgi:HSP20 family protein